jgi:signal transduction histidine kinase
MTRLWQRLDVRIGIAGFVMLVALASVLLLWWHAQRERTDLEATQRLNLGLARYVIEHQPKPLIDAQGRPERDLLQAMAMDVMMTNPAVEVYLLDRQGSILGHALDGARVARQRVSLAPVQALLGNEGSANLPLLGDDPSAPDSPNIFSVAPVADAVGVPRGYLYVVLRGAAAQSLSPGAARSSLARDTTAAVVLACAAAIAVWWATLARLTRPLRGLAARMQSFRAEDTAAATTHQPTLVDGDEIAQLNRTLSALQARVASQFRQMEDSDRMRRELITNLSHDLHTPLTCIQGYAEHCLLKNDQLDAGERAQSLQALLRHCASLAKRIADLFELSKLDAGRVVPRLEVFCLAELLQDVAGGYALTARERGVTLAVGAASLTSALVRADIALIERVFQNLLDNALRHTPAGGSVQVDIEALPKELRVSVADTGAGIAQEHMAHVFERYYRAQDATTVNDGPSAGLGLAIVKRILELHGSAIGVRSELAKGTRFQFSLPRAA